MKNILKYLLLSLFGINAIGAFIGKNYDSAFGWLCAFMCEIELLQLRKKIKDCGK